MPVRVDLGAVGRDYGHIRNSSRRWVGGREGLIQRRSATDIGVYGSRSFHFLLQVFQLGGVDPEQVACEDPSFFESPFPFIGPRGNLPDASINLLEVYWHNFLVLQMTRILRTNVSRLYR